MHTHANTYDAERNESRTYIREAIGRELSGFSAGELAFCADTSLAAAERSINEAVAYLDELIQREDADVGLCGKGTEAENAKRVLTRIRYRLRKGVAL